MNVLVLVNFLFIGYVLTEMTPLQSKDITSKILPDQIRVYSRLFNEYISTLGISFNLICFTTYS